MTPTIFSPVKMNTTLMEEIEEDGSSSVVGGGGSVGKVGLKWSKKEVSPLLLYDCCLLCWMIVIVCGYVVM